MRIVNIMLAEVRGGVETMAMRYHQALRSAGFEVLSAGHSRGVFAEAVAAGDLAAGEFRPVDAYINHDPFAAWRLRDINRRFRPDIVLAHGNRPAGIALLPFTGLGRRTVQVVHNFRHKPQVERLRAAISVSASVSAHLRASHPGLAVFDVLNFAPLDARPVKPAPGTPVIGTLGRLHENKGIDVMLRAFARLRGQGITARLRIAGDGPERLRLQALAAELGLSEVVDFTGWVSPAADYLATLDLFVLPSRVEPFGLVVAEAMAAGVPVIASDIDGPREILKGGALGRLAAAEDEAALAQAMAAAIGDWDGTLNQATAARAHALDQFSLDAGAHRLKTAVEQIAPIFAERP